MPEQHEQRGIKQVVQQSADRADQSVVGPVSHSAASNGTANALPIIDITSLFSDEPHARRRVAADLGHAARNSGFFYISHHAIPPRLVDDLFAASREFHERSRRYKMRYWSGFTTNHRGYVPFEENGDSFPKTINYNESFDLSYPASADHPDFLAEWRMTGPNVWPDIPQWQSRVEDYYKHVFDLGHRLLGALAEDIGVDPAVLKQHINTPTSQLRMLRYIENDMDKSSGATGFEAHSDFECFTILLQGGPGLQVLHTDGAWIDAPPIPGCFIVNIGDIFEAWTGGMFKSTQHRVVNTGRERYSFPLFFGLDYHAIVEPLPGFRTAEAVERYPAIKAGDHLMRMSVGQFRYMRDAVANGELQLDVAVPDVSPFLRIEKTRNGKRSE